MATEKHVAELEQKAEELRAICRSSSDVENFTVTTVPDDLKILIEAHMKDGRVYKKEIIRKRNS